MKLKNIIPICVLLILLSCGSSKILKSNIQFNELKNLEHSETFYEFINLPDENFQYHKFNGIIEKTLDSVFRSEEIKKVLNGNKNNLEQINIDVLDLVNNIRARNSIINIKVPKTLISAYAQNESRYLVVPLIKLKIISAEEKYPDVVLVNYSNEDVYLNGIETHLTIIDIKEKAIVFYGNDSSDFRHTFYRKELITEIKSIIRSMRKSDR